MIDLKVFLTSEFSKLQLCPLQDESLEILEKLFKNFFKCLVRQTSTDLSVLDQKYKFLF